MLVDKRYFIYTARSLSISSLYESQTTYSSKPALEAGGKGGREQGGK